MITYKNKDIWIPDGREERDQREKEDHERERGMFELTLGQTKIE